MEVQLTPDQQAFLRQAIETGRYQREEDALAEAFAMWEQRERRRAELLASIDLAEASFARGEGVRIETRQELAELTERIQRRGLARLISIQKNP
jgi:Arc/MetJ-type ribon-helix-helix transcriptional regulator